MDLSHFELSHYDGYFHLFTVANTAYALSPELRRIVNAGLSKATLNKEDVDSQVKRLKKHFETCKRIEKYDQMYINLQGQIENLFKEFSNKAIDLDAEYKTESGVVGFKRLYLVSGLLSLFILILAGFQQFFQDHVVFCNVLFWVIVLFVFKGLVIAILDAYEILSEMGLRWICGISLIIVTTALVYSLEVTIANDVTGRWFSMWIMILAVTFPITPYILQFYSENTKNKEYLSKGVSLRAEFEKRFNNASAKVDFLKESSNDLPTSTSENRNIVGQSLQS